MGSATGFFYARQKDESYFLVTNRHVVEDQDHPRIRFDALRLALHTDANDVRKNGSIDLPLYEGNNRLWRSFDDPGIDIVALPLDKSAIHGFIIQAFSSSVLPPSDLQIGIGEDVLVIGYPLGFHDDVHNLPIFRNASVASVYPVPFKGKPFFLIDARLHPGTSGSPVVLKPSTVLKKGGGLSFMSAPVTYLLGINSGEWKVRDEGLGLNAVWFASLVNELTSS